MTAAAGRLLDARSVRPSGVNLGLAEGPEIVAAPELGLVFAGRPDGPATLASVLAATRAVVAAVTIAGAEGEIQAVVLGSVAAAPRDLVDLRLVGCVLRIDGEVVATAAGAGAPLGHPALAAAALLDGESGDGRHIGPGAVVLTGALTAYVPVTPGAVVTAEFDGLGVAEFRR